MKRTMTFFLLIIILVALYITRLHSTEWFAPEPDSFSNSVTLTGHRGAAGYVPENTLSSIQKALEIGVDRVEIDVQQTKDGIVLALHDKTVDRTTNGKGLLKDFTFEEARTLDAGSYFSKKFEGEKIPTLNEILELVDGKCKLVIEIKDGGEFYPNIEENILASIEKHNAKSWIIIHSFNDLPLFKINKLAPDIELHKLFVLKLPYLPIFLDTDWGRKSLDRYPFVSEFSFYYKFIDKALIDNVHQHGKKINVWTANDSVRIQKLIHLGVDGIITNYPKLLKRSSAKLPNAELTR